MRIMRNRSKILSALMLVALVSSLAFGQAGPAQVQQQQTTKGAVVKGKAPVNKEVLKVKLPRAEEAKLANGMQVVLLHSAKVPTFNMQMAVEWWPFGPCRLSRPRELHCIVTSRRNQNTFQ